MVKQKSSAGRYRYEYVKHLQKNACPTALCLIIFIAIMLGIICISIMIVNPLVNNSKYIESCNYTYAIESEIKDSNYRLNYKLENLVTFYSAGKRINVNTYLYSDNGIYKYEGIIDKNEVVISQQIANKLNVDIGDEIEIDLPIYDVPSKYFVKEVIPYVSDYYNVEENNDFAVAFLGYDDKLESKIRGKFILFLNENEYSEFTNSSASYDQRYYLPNEIDSLNNKAVLYVTALLIVSGSIVCVYHISIAKIIKSELIKYRNDSFSLKIVKGYYTKDHIIYSTLPLLLMGIIGIILNVSSPYLLGYAFISAVLTLWWIIGGKYFEKAA